MLFSELGLGSEVLRAIEDKGYTTPTPIQEQAIPWVLQGRDVLGCAQTGTGKTAGFTLPMIDILASGRARARMPRSLILEPTRELAAQVADSFEMYGRYHKLNMALLIGGVHGRCQPFLNDADDEHRALGGQEHGEPPPYFRWRNGTTGPSCRQPVLPDGDKSHCAGHRQVDRVV